METIHGSAVGQRDLMALMSAQVGTLLDELELAADGTGDEQGLPPRANQLARLLVDGVVRLIRVGTLTDLADAADALSEAIIGEAANRLATRRPEAFRLLSAAATVLAAAVTPHSSGGELTALRSWRGKAAEAVRMVRDSPDECLARAELLGKLGIEESHLSHLLSDLEAGGLIDRVRDGRQVTVLLGPTAKLPHVTAFIDGIGDQTEVEGVIRDVIQSAITVSDSPPSAVAPEARSDLDGLRACVARFREYATAPDISINEVMLGRSEAVVSIRVVGRRLIGDAPLAPIDTEVHWSVVMDKRQVTRLRPLAECDDWLGVNTGTSMMVAADIRDIGYELDKRSELQLTRSAAAELVIGEPIRVDNTEAAPNDLLTEAITRVVTHQGEGSDDVLSLR